MAQDDYIYQSIPIPQVPPFGGNALNNALSTSMGSSSDPNISTAAYSSVPSPFSDGVGGGGTPAPPPLTCADDIQANTLSTSAVSFPCESSTSTIQVSGASFDDGSGNTATIGYNGVVEIVNGGKTCTIDVTGLPNGAVAQFRSFTDCAGKTFFALATAST